MKTYKFNDCGCCLNPETEVIFDHNKGYAEVSWAYHEGFYYCGYDFQKRFNDWHGSTSGVCLGEHRDKGESLHDLKRRILDHGLKIFNDPATPNHLIAALKKAQFPQLELF